MRIPLLTNLHFRFSFIYPDLLEPIDVYCSWIDATEAMQRTAQESAQSSSGGGVAAYSDQHADEDNEDLDVEVESFEERKKKLEAQHAAEEAEIEAAAVQSASAPAVLPVATKANASEPKEDTKDFDDLFGDSSDSDNE